MLNFTEVLVFSSGFCLSFFGISTPSSVPAPPPPGNNMGLAPSTTTAVKSAANYAAKSAGNAMNDLNTQVRKPFSSPLSQNSAAPAAPKSAPVLNQPNPTNSAQGVKPLDTSKSATASSGIDQAIDYFLQPKKALISPFF